MNAFWLQFLFSIILFILHRPATGNLNFLQFFVWKPGYQYYPQFQGICWLPVWNFREAWFHWTRKNFFPVSCFSHVVMDPAASPLSILKETPLARMVWVKHIRRLCCTINELLRKFPETIVALRLIAASPVIFPKLRICSPQGCMAIFSDLRWISHRTW